MLFVPVLFSGKHMGKATLQGHRVLHWDESRRRTWDLKKLSMQTLIRSRLPSTVIAGICIGPERRRNTSAAEADVESFFTPWLAYVGVTKCMRSVSVRVHALVAHCPVVWQRQIHLVWRRQCGQCQLSTKQWIPKSLPRSSQPFWNMEELNCIM